jgi:hypothetical protein
MSERPPERDMEHGGNIPRDTTRTTHPNRNQARIEIEIEIEPI